MKNKRGIRKNNIKVFAIYEKWNVQFLENY